jgi:predicted PurR-regulated permease PerM
LSKLVGGGALSTAGDVGLRILGSVREIVGTITSLILAAVLIPVYAFFFALALPRWRSRWPAYVPTASRALWQRVAHRIGASIAGFLRGRVIVCLIVGLITAAGWWALGVRLGVLLGLATGALTLIPLASVLAFVPVAVMALIDVATDVHGWAWFAGVAVIYLVGQIADSVLNPVIVGDAVDLDMMTMIIALLAGGAAFGMIGLLVAVPAAATLRILADEVVLPHWRAWANRDTASESRGADSADD